MFHENLQNSALLELLLPSVFINLKIKYNQTNVVTSFSLEIYYWIVFTWIPLNGFFNMKIHSLCNNYRFFCPQWLKHIEKLSYFRNNFVFSICPIFNESNWKITKTYFWCYRVILSSVSGLIHVTSLATPALGSQGLTSYIVCCKILGHDPIYNFLNWYSSFWTFSLLEAFKK